MKHRREFIKTTMRWLTGCSFFLSPILPAIKSAYAAAEKKLLPKETELDSLKSMDPADLDTRNLEITPIDKFDTMGTTDHEVDLKTWSLEIKGLVKTPIKLTYDQLLALPSIEKNVLLICPGVFSYHGRWKGISMKALFDQAGLKSEATDINFIGPNIQYEKAARYPVEDVLSDKVFLAYGVNGKTLPQKHGFPLRVIAQDTYGSDWVKYVHLMEAEIF